MKRCKTGILHAAILVAVAFVAQDVRGQYDPDAPEPIPRLKGTLFLGGGGALVGEAYQRFVEMAGAGDARIIVLSASATEPAGADVEQLKLLADVTSLYTVSLPTANLASFAAPIADATGVWISGEDGAHFADVFHGTPVEQALVDLIARRGVIGCNGDISRAMTSAMIDGTEAALDKGLDVIPGAVIDTGFADTERKLRMVDVLIRQPSLVGLGIETGATMILHHRFIDVLGPGSAYSYIAANGHKGMRMEQINREASPRSQRRTPERQAQTEAIIAEWRASQPQRQQRGGGRGQRGGGRGGRGRGQQARPFQPRRLADLIAMSREAVGRTLERYPAEEPPPPIVENGTLIIVGGGGSPPGLTERFIELAGGADHAYLVYVPCSEEEEITSEPGIVDSWRRLGVRSATWIHTKDRDKADNDPWILNHLRKATGIWFGGGRQWNLVDSYQHTTAHRLMQRVLSRGGVIGGSSAGASIQGAYMVRGNPMGNVDPMADGYETGLGFITGFAIDQHFTQRGRLPDMTETVNRYPQLLGVGLDEAASIIVQGSVAEVFTREGRNAHFYDRSEPVADGEPDHITLVNGQLYDLVERGVIATEADITADVATTEAMGVTGAAGAAPAMVGVWEVTSSSDFGESVSTLRIGSDLSVTYENSQFETEISNAVVESDRISFELRLGNFEQTASFSAALQDGVLSGAISFGGEIFAEVKAVKTEGVVEAAAAVEQVPALVGTWDLMMYSDFGDSGSTMVIGPDLTVAYEMTEFGAELDIADLKIEGSQISFELGFGGSGQSATFAGGITEDGSFAGTLSAEGQTFAEISGTKRDGGGAAEAIVAEVVEEVAAVEPAAEEAPALVGIWDITSYSDFGDSESTLTIGADLSVTYVIPQFEVELEIPDAQIDGNRISFELGMGGSGQSAQFEGQVVDGALTGTISFQGQVFAEIKGVKRDGQRVAA